MQCEGTIRVATAEVMGTSDCAVGPGQTEVADREVLLPTCHQPPSCPLPPWGLVDLELAGRDDQLQQLGDSLIRGGGIAEGQRAAMADVVDQRSPGVVLHRQRANKVQ